MCCLYVVCHWNNLHGMNEYNMIRKRVTEITIRGTWLVMPKSQRRRKGWVNIDAQGSSLKTQALPM